MPTPAYLPTASLSAIDGDTAPPGTLAYFPHKYVQHFGLIAVAPDGTRFILDLGGDKPFGVHRAGDGLETAIVVADWRIEVDSASAVPVRYENLSAGQAFIAGVYTGLVGYHAGAGIGALAVTVNSSGTMDPPIRNIHRGAFTRWRIVTGPVERPAVIVDSEVLVPAGQ